MQHLMCNVVLRTVEIKKNRKDLKFKVNHFSLQKVKFLNFKI